MTDLPEPAPPLHAVELVVATRNAVAEAIGAIGTVAGVRVTVWDDDDPEGTPRERLALNPLGPRAGLVVADHDAPGAYDLLREALRGDAGYVAMLASRPRTAAVLDLLSGEGFDAAALERLHLPAGLDTGGKTPGEIALSVVAEVVAWSHGRDGQPMRDRPAPRPSP
jgi:xanthine/CO dehydrogenase XdhC/CoxF family maturation factor